MRAALRIAAKDLRLRMRDRSAWLVAFVAPIVLAVIISGAFSGGDGAGFRTRILVADLDGTAVSESLQTQVLGSEGLREIVDVEAVATEDEAREGVQNGRAFGAIVVPAGFTDAMTSGSAANVRTITSGEFPATQAFVDAIARSWTRSLDATRLAIVTALSAGSQTPLPELAQAAQVAATRATVSVQDVEAATREVKPANYFGPGMAIFFLFFTVGFAARGLVAERAAGTMARLGAAPVSRLSILVGKSLPAFVIGLTSLFVMFGFMRLAFGVRWGDPVAIVVLSAATVFAVFGITSLVQLAAKTEQQAQTYVQVLGAGLALIGGNFFPLYEMPQLMQRVAMATPNAWALRGFSDIAFDAAGLSGIAISVVVLLGIGLVATALSASRAGRLVSA